MIRSRSIIDIYVDAPRDGESPSSWFDRSCQYYGLTRRTLFALFDVAMPVHLDLDSITGLNHGRAALRSMGWKPSDLRMHVPRSPDLAWMMAPKSRNCYCPLCFTEDLCGKSIPYFRLEWGMVCLTHCTRHGTPLFEWKRRLLEGMRVLPQDWLNHPSSKVISGRSQIDSDIETLSVFKEKLRESPISSQVWKSLLDFERRCIRFVTPLALKNSRSEFRRDREFVAQLLIFVTYKNYAAGNFSILGHLCPSFVDERILGFRGDDLRRVPESVLWSGQVQRLRCIATRRAALWTVATLIDELGDFKLTRNAVYHRSSTTAGWIRKISIDDKFVFSEDLAHAIWKALLRTGTYAMFRPQMPYNDLVLLIGPKRADQDLAPGTWWTPTGRRG